jgi:hypothetical protein
MKTCTDCKVALTELNETPSSIARGGRCRSCEANYRISRSLRKLNLTESEFIEAREHIAKTI